MRKFTALCAVSFVPALLYAEAGRSSGSLLTRTLSARAAAMGQALVADSGEIDGIFFNPAGVAQLPAPEISATYQNGLLDDSIGGANFGTPTQFGAWYVGLSALDAGKIELNQSDGTTGSRNAQQDVSAQLGIAFGRKGPWSMGATAKYLRSELAESATADTIAGDLGLSVEAVKGLRFGAAIQNVGSDLKYEEIADPLPTLGRFGASYTWDLEESVRAAEFLRCRYLITIDGVKPREDDVSMNAGLEIRKRIDTPQYPGWAAVRGGYISATKAIAVGAGFTLWNVSIDYALNVLNGLDNTHRFTLGYRFAANPTEL